MCKDLYILTIHSDYHLPMGEGSGAIHLLSTPSPQNLPKCREEDRQAMKMTSCSRKSTMVVHETGIAQMIRKPPSQQQQAASKTTSILIPIPEAVVQTMRAREKPKAMSFAEAQERIARELHLPSVRTAVTQAPVSQPVQQAPEPSPWGHRPLGSKGLPSERIAEAGRGMSFAEAEKRLRKETGINIFGGK